MPAPPSSVTPADHVLAKRLAIGTGQLLVQIRAELVAAGADGATIKDEGDARSNEFLLGELAANVPAGDRVLSEESGATHDDASRLSASRVWIIDPLDGTREFSETGRTDWAVHVALCVDGVAECGAVALPALDTCFSTADPVIELPLPGDPPRVVVSRSRPPAEAEVVRAALGGTIVEMGSAGAKVMSLLRGEADCYPHSGGQYEWDSAAPVAVARHHGLHASRLDGAPLRYNRADPYLPDLLVCRPELVDATLQALTG